MKTLFTLLLLFSLTNSHALENGVDGLKLKLAPLSAADPRGSNLPIEAEYCFGRIWGTSLSASIPFMGTLPGYGDPEKKKITQDIRLRGDFRLYLSKNAVRGFMGIEGIYRAQHRTITSATWHDGRDSYGAASSNIRKSVFYLNYIIGFEHRISNRLFLEMSGGLGVKFVHVDRENLQPYRYGTFAGFSSFVNEDELAGSETQPTFAVGFKIGYLLWDKQKRNR